MRPRISGIFGPIVAVTLAAASLRAQPAPQPPPAPEPDAGAPVVTPPRESAVTPAPAPSQAPTPGYPAFPPPYNPYPYYPRYGYPPPTYAPPPDPRVEQRRLRTGEAHADHVILMPTAYTHPAGTVYFSSIDIVLLQAGYAISDDTQVTLSGTPPLGEDNVFPLDLSLKNALVNEGPVRVAAIGSITGIAGLDEGNFFLGRIGGAAQLCFDTPCKSSASVASTAPSRAPPRWCSPASASSGTWRTGRRCCSRWTPSCPSATKPASTTPSRWAPASASPTRTGPSISACSAHWTSKSPRTSCR